MSQKPDEEFQDAEGAEPVEGAEAQAEEEVATEATTNAAPMADANEEMEDVQPTAAEEGGEEEAVETAGADEGDEENAAAEEADEPVQPPPSKKAAAKPKVPPIVAKPAAAATDEPKGKKRSAPESGTTSPRTKPGTNAARTRNLSAFFETTVVAHSNAMAAKLKKPPTNSAEVTAINEEHYKSPVVVLGSDIGDEGAYELVEPEMEGALEALREFAGEEPVPEEDDEKASEDGGKQKKVTIKGVSTHVPKRNDAYNDWLKSKFGEFHFVSNCNGRYIREKKSGIVRLVHNATVVPSIGAQFLSLLTSKSKVAIGDREYKAADIEIRFAKTHKEYVDGGEGAGTDEHCYVELFDKPGDITSYPCERAFISTMPLDVLLSHSEKLSGFFAPRFLYNLLAKMNSDKGGKKGGSKAAASSKTEDAEAEAEKPATASSSKKRTAKEAAQQSVTNVELPVKQRSKAPAGANGHHDEAADDFVAVPAENNGMIDAMDRNHLNFAALDTVGRNFSKGMTARMKAFEEERKKATDLAASVPTDGSAFYPAATPEGLDANKSALYQQFVASLAEDSVLRKVAKALVFVEDDAERKTRLVQTMKATSVCIGAKPEIITNATPAALKVEFERVIGLFGDDSAAEWRKHVGEDGKLDLAKFMGVFANAKTSPLCRSIFMTAFVAGTLIGADESFKFVRELADKMAKVTKFYAEQLKDAQSSVSELVRESSVEMARAQESIHNKHTKATAELTTERDSLKAAAKEADNKVKALEEQLAKKTAELEAAQKKFAADLEAAQKKASVAPAAPKAAATPKADSAKPAAAPASAKPAAPKAATAKPVAKTAAPAEAKPAAAAAAKKPAAPAAAKPKAAPAAAKPAPPPPAPVAEDDDDGNFA